MTLRRIKDRSNPRVLLRELCKQKGGFAQVAKRLGVTRQALYLIASESRRPRVNPSHDLARRIHEELGIDRLSWFPELRSDGDAA